MGADVRQEAEVADAVSPVLRQYISNVRPWLMRRRRQQHDSLWVDNRGAPLAADNYSAKVQRITERISGLRISPHLFRNAAATTLARTSPESAQLIRPLQSHSSHQTAGRHYNHARTIDAARGYAEIVAALRNGA